MAYVRIKYGLRNVRARRVFEIFDTASGEIVAAIQYGRDKRKAYGRAAFARSALNRHGMVPLVRGLLYAREQHAANDKAETPPHLAAYFQWVKTSLKGE